MIDFIAIIDLCRIYNIEKGSIPSEDHMRKIESLSHHMGRYQAEKAELKDEEDRLPPNSALTQSIINEYLVKRDEN